MRRDNGGDRERAWIVDYSAARERAIKWLGDRYLLARPINLSDSAWRRLPQSTSGSGGPSGR